MVQTTAPACGRAMCPYLIIGTHCVRFSEMRRYKVAQNPLIYNVVKEYPDMIRIYIYKTPYALPEPGYTRKEPKRPKDGINDDSIHRSIRRTKSTIADLVLCNNFEYFCTFTFDPKKHDRYDVNRCKFIMSMWLHRQRKHSPEMKYLIVPEFHKDGALHFHALLANFNGTLKDSKKRQNGRIIYNMTGYRAGFTTAVPIDHNKVAVSNYIKKYITKDMPLIYGRKRYWVSQNLDKPIKTVNAFSRIKNLPLFTKKTYETEYYEVYETMKI